MFAERSRSLRAHHFQGRQRNPVLSAAAKQEFAGPDDCERRARDRLVTRCAIERELWFVRTVAIPAGGFHNAGLIVENDLAAIRELVDAVRARAHLQSAERNQTVLLGGLHCEPVTRSLYIEPLRQQPLQAPPFQPVADSASELLDSARDTARDQFANFAGRQFHQLSKRSQLAPEQSHGLVSRVALIFLAHSQIRSLQRPRAQTMFCKRSKLACSHVFEQRCAARLHGFCHYRRRGFIMQFLDLDAGPHLPHPLSLQNAFTSHQPPATSHHRTRPQRTICFSAGITQHDVPSACQ